MGKICKDCKWFEPASYASKTFEREVYLHAKCNAPQNMMRDKVESLVGAPAKVTRRWSFCRSQRDEGFLWAYLMKSCGKHARWFKAKGKE